MTIYIDIDDTICKTPKKPNGDPDYEKAKPLVKRIEKINNLFEQGHTINYWTARGTLSGKDLQCLTRSQLKAWGAKYHELMLGKPYYDLFIDDKNQNASILDQDITDCVIH